MKKTLIQNGVLVTGSSARKGDLLLGNGRILSCDFHGEILEDTEVYNAQGGYVLPAFIELHAHGGGGHDFVDGTQEAFSGALQAHLSHGVTLLCPTLVSCEWENVQRFLGMMHDFSSPFMGKAHLEGPFLSPQMCGAQNMSCIIPPSRRHIDELKEHAAVLSCITAAPEVDGVMELACALSPLGVQFSIGHSEASADTVRKAADAGFSRITHLYSATSRRFKIGSYVTGAIEETALIDDRFTVELIGDGHHVCKESLLLTEKCKGIDHTCLVSDAMRAAGSSEDGESYLGEIKEENRVILEDGVAKLPDRSSFAGSMAAGDMMVQALCGPRYQLPLPEIAHMMSAVPARLLGLEQKRGQIKEGMDAEITVLDEHYRTQAVFSQGKKVYEV
ncbi:MAG: hypothetical protein E7329_05660 [Clostridiales bacterium]|nr:hypothetical protein [Clostridiales bacterium]